MYSLHSQRLDVSVVVCIGSDMLTQALLIHFGVVPPSRVNDLCHYTTGTLNGLGA
jgi:hypothetical protein